MRRLCALVATFLVAVSGCFALVAAQEDAATPEVGTPVSLVNADGAELALITVAEVVDPFEDAADEPPRGQRFVLAVIDVEATGEEPLAIDPEDLLLQDADGFLFFPEEVDLGDEEPLEATDLEPGDTLSGAVVFAVADEAGLARLFLAPDDDRLVLLADLRSAAESEDLLADVETFEDLSTAHTPDPVDYEQTPPVGGPHNPTWQDCGFYDTPVASEHAVHSLEHGAVWITYDPDLPADQVAILEELAEANAYVIVSPFPDLPAPVVASAWGVQLQLDGADDPRLQAFVDFYQQGPQTPEPGAPCSGGTSDTSAED